MTKVFTSIPFVLRNVLIGKSHNKVDLEVIRQQQCSEFERIKSRIEAFVSVPSDDSVIDTLVDFEFPVNFVRQRMKYVKGHIEWRDFASGLNEHAKTVISGQVKFEPGASLSCTYHRNAMTYLYVITGQILDKQSGRMLTPYVEVPYEIAPSQKYELHNTGEVDCNFVMKYVMI